MRQYSDSSAGIGAEGFVPTAEVVASGELEAPPGRPAKLAPYQDEHRPQVFQLYREVFGPGAAESFQARWRWAQEECPYPQDNPKWVLLDGERVVGFLNTIALPYLVRGSTVLAHTPCDYMVHPAYRFHGIGLMREFFRSCQNCVTCDDIPSTIKVTRWLGAQQIGLLVRHVKVLDARALGQKWPWATTTPAMWLINMALRRPAISHLRLGPAPYRVGAAHRLDRRFQVFFERLTPLAPVMPVRDVRFLEWRYGTGSPHAGREIGVVTDSGDQLLGYVIYYRSQGPDCRGYILDLQTLPSQVAGVGSSLLNYAVERLRAGGAWSVRYHHLAARGTLPAQVLREHGFMPRGGHRVMVRFQDSAVAHLAASAGNWNYSYGDSEASHAII